jgi:hypothetical protein
MPAQPAIVSRLAPNNASFVDPIFAENMVSNLGLEFGGPV